MSKTIIFHFHSLMIIGFGFLLKILSLSMYSDTSNFNSQQRLIDILCEKDILHVEPICQLKAYGNLYFESSFLGKAAIVVGLISISILVYNQVCRLYPSKFNFIVIALNVILIFYSFLVWA